MYCKRYDTKHRKVKKDMETLESKQAWQGKALGSKKATLNPTGECERGQQWDMTLSL